MIDRSIALLTIAAAKKESRKAVADAMPEIERVVKDAVADRDMKSFADMAVTIKGEPGRDGNDGVDGKDGRDGAKGDVGSKGPPGKDGRDGKDGKDGAKGENGDKGDIGPRGLKGPPGKDGEDGVGVESARINPRGELIVTLTNGETVNAGIARGRDGISMGGGGGGGSGSGGVGQKGDPGASAYEVSVVNGFTGTQSEWLASLVGPVGPAGADGADGAQGPQGIKGDTGATGPKGDTGDQGPQGIQGIQGVPGVFSASLIVPAPSGAYISNVITAAALITVTGTAGRCWLTPFISARNVTVARLGMEVTTLLAASTSKVAVYSDVNGIPTALLAGGVTSLDNSTIGLKEETVSFTFQAGVVYWIAIATSSTQVVRGAAVANWMPLSVNSANGSPFNCRLGTLTGMVMPATFGSTNLSGTTSPVIRMRVV